MITAPAATPKQGCVRSGVNEVNAEPERAQPPLFGLTLEEWAAADKLTIDLTYQVSFANALQLGSPLTPDADSMRMIQFFPEQQGEWARLADFYDRAQTERGLSLRAARP